MHGVHLHQRHGGVQTRDVPAAGLPGGETDVLVAQPVLPAMPMVVHGKGRDVQGQRQDLHGEIILRILTRS